MKKYHSTYPLINRTDCENVFVLRMLVLIFIPMHKQMTFLVFNIYALI